MHFIESKSILNKKKTRDSWFLDDYTLNPFSGCTFNCSFCYVNGSKYGYNASIKASYKRNAVDLLSKELKRLGSKKQYGYIVLSSSTDPYLNEENDLLLTRKLLEVILNYRFPVHIITRSPLVVRDADLLKEIRDHSFLPEDLIGKSDAALITFSFSTTDDDVASIFEPAAPLPSRRLDAVAQCIDSGLKTGISLMPLLPSITDDALSIDRFYSEFAKVKAQYVMAAGLTLHGPFRGDSRQKVFRKVQNHYPQLLPFYEKMYGNADDAGRAYRSILSQRCLNAALKHGLKSKIIQA